MIRKDVLFKENEKLKRQVFIFQNIGVSTNATVREKEDAAKRFLETFPDYNLYEVSETIRINRGTLYHHLYTKTPKPWFVERRETLTEEVIKVFEESNKLYGAGKISIALRKKGINADTKTIRKIMKENNLQKIIVVKRKKEYSAHQKPNYYKNYLCRQFNQDAPNKVWASDFLEIKVRGVRFYVCVILDLFARKVVAWRLSHKLSDSLLINTFKDAFQNRNEPENLMFHSDQGSQFKSHDFMEMLKMLGVKQSFSRPGNPNDNACMEGFYSKLRSEEINVNIDKYENSRVINEYLAKYFNFYNTKRIHTSNGGLTPNEREDEWYKNNLN